MRRRPAIHSRKRFHLPPSVWIRRFGKALGLIFFISAACFILYTINIRFFTIQTVEVHGANVRVTIDRARFNDQLLFFPVQEYRQELLSQYQQLADVTISKRLPHTLVLDLVLRTPIARLELNDGVVVVDGQGVVIRAAGSGDSGLPRLVFPGLNVHEGMEVFDPGVKAGLAFLTTTDGSIPVDTIAPYESQSLRAVSGKTDIFLPQNTDMKEVVTTLQTLFSRFRMKGTMPATIDVRFQKPIVKL